jgi:hypothetical protein
LELTDSKVRRKLENQLSDEYDVIMSRSDWKLNLNRIKEINKQIEKIWLYEDRQGWDPFLTSYLRPLIEEWKKKNAKEANNQLNLLAQE